MKSVILISLILFPSVKLMAQKADGTQAVITSLKIDSTRSILFSLLANELSKSDGRAGIEAARDGITIAQKIKFEKGLFENYYSLASIYQGQSSFDR